jgi:hypothetical protein
VRGGSWINDARNVRSAYRNDNQRGNRNHNLGFRVALSSTGGTAWMRRARPWTRWRIQRRAANRLLCVKARPPGCW